MTGLLCWLGLHRWSVWEDFQFHPLYPMQKQFCTRCNHQRNRYV